MGRERKRGQKLQFSDETREGGSNKNLDSKRSA